MDQLVALVPHTTARRIQEMIRVGELREGALLPSQRELSERLDVSRSSLREAAAEPDLYRWRFGKRYSPSEVYQFRFVTEGHAARLAAMRVSPAELAALMQNLKDFKDAVREQDLVASSQLDFGFHRLVMECSGNRVFADLYGSYGSVLLESQRLPLTRRERLWEPVTEHENVVHAIEKRDPDSACYFMHVHIMRAADRSGIALSEAV